MALDTREMAKPLSRPNEIGRAIGYNVEVNVILDRLKQTPGADWDRALVEQVERAARGPEAGDARPKRLWVVVKVERGVPVMMDAYRDKRSANRREKFLRQHMHADSDEVRLFEIKL